MGLVVDNIIGLHQDLSGAFLCWFMMVSRGQPSQPVMGAAGGGVWLYLDE